MPNHGDAVIELRGVQKKYRKVHALKGVDLNVHAGEVFGLLGPNGAGKSTLVKILMTVVRPTRVEGMVLGHPVGHKQTLRRVGYLPEHARFPSYLTGRQVVENSGAMAGLTRAERRRNASEWLSIVGASDYADRKVKSYSKGMQQRIGIAQAMVHDPDIVLLDEPTDGVDPMGRKQIRETLTELKNRGKTVMVNSHLLSELEMICQRVAILVSGQIAKQGHVDELTLDQQRYEIEVLGTETQIRQALGLSAEQTIWQGYTAEIKDSVLSLEVTDPHQAQPALDAIRAAGLVVIRMILRRPSLEDLFMQVTETNSQRSGGAA